jgi:hypothetical protein
MTYFDRLISWGKYSRESLYYWNRFGNFFLLFKAIFVVEAVAITATVLSTRPKVSSPFFYIPMSVLGLTLVIYLTTAVLRLSALFRSRARDRRNLKQGVALDLPAVGWRPARNWKPA